MTKIICVALCVLALVACESPTSPTVVNIYNNNQATNAAAADAKAGIASVQVEVTGVVLADGETAPAGTYAATSGAVFRLEAIARDAAGNRVAASGVLPRWDVTCTPLDAMALEGGTSGPTPSLRVLVVPARCQVSVTLDGKTATATFTGTLR